MDSNQPEKMTVIESGKLRQVPKLAPRQPPEGIPLMTTLVMTTLGASLRVITLGFITLLRLSIGHKPQDAISIKPD